MKPDTTLNAFLRRLIWLCVLPLVLLNVYFATDQVFALRTKYREDAQGLVRNFATALDQDIAARSAGLQTLAASPFADTPLRLAEFYKEAQGFRDNFGGQVILADLSMQMLLNTRSSFGAVLPKLPRPSGHAAVTSVLETGRPAVGDSFPGPIAKQTLIAVAVPVMREGRTRLLLINTVEIRQLQQRIEKLVLPHGSALTLYDGSGSVLARSGPPGPAAVPVGDAAQDRIVIKLALAPWSVALDIPRSIVLAPLTAAATALLAAILLTTLISVVTARRAGRRLARELAGLTQAGSGPSPVEAGIAEIKAAHQILADTAAARAEAESSLRQSEQRFKLAAATGNVWDWDLQTNQVTFPPEFWLGLGYDEQDKANSVAQFESVLHPHDRPRWRQAIKDHVSRRMPYDFDYRARAQAGEYRWFNTRGQAQWDENGRATYMAGTTFDITEKKHAEEQIQGYIAQLESAFTGALEVATTLSEIRDPYTAGHERRVADIAGAIGAELGFDAHRQEGLRVAGYLHDVGKLTLPMEILAKPGKLSALEFQLVQAHAQASYDVLKDVTFPWPVAEVARQHHERLDGSGYPQGLMGEAILLEARILAVADVVEAMASHRPYRVAQGIDKALAEIKRGRGSAYDPMVVDACLRLFLQKAFLLPI